MRKPLNRVINYVCRRRLVHTLPEIEDKLVAYSKGSATTGTQWTTLWFGVGASRYFLPNMACKFNLDIGRLKKQHMSTDFHSNLFGALRLK